MVGDTISVVGKVLSGGNNRLYIFSNQITKLAVQKPKRFPPIQQPKPQFVPSQRPSVPLQQPSRIITLISQLPVYQKLKELLNNIDKKVLIIGLVLLLLIVSMSFYFYNKPKKTEIPSFLESVNEDFAGALDSCVKTRNVEKRDKCLYRAAPYALKNNVSLAIDICKKIEDGSEVNRCLNFLSMYVVKRDINLSIDICSNIGNVSLKNNCILSLVPDLVQQDTNKTLELCTQFDIKDDCNYNIAFNQISLEESKVYCEKITDSNLKASCLDDIKMNFEMFNESFVINETINESINAT